MIALVPAAWALLSDKPKAAIALIGGFFIGALLAFVAVTFAYEGLRLPLIGQVIDGRVQSAVKAATSDLVARAEYDAVAAALARREIEAQTANAAAAVLRDRITQAEKDRADAEKRLEDELAADRDAGRAVVTDADLRWMSRH